MTRTEAAAWLANRDNFCILTHRNPDGDTIGCAVALCLGLRSLGKAAHILDNSQFTPRYHRWLAGLTAAETGETVVAVDIASETLLPDNAAMLSGRVGLIIDHHGSNTGFAPNCYVNPSAAACGELIHELLCSLGVVLTPEIADAIYLAVATDTGCFQYANTTAGTLRTAADMMDAGCGAHFINKLFYGTKSLPRLRLEARLTESMERFADGRVALCHLPLAWMEALELCEDDIDSIAGFPRAVEGVEVGVMIREMPGYYKISLRSGALVNASAVCARLNGGGHRAAAGGRVKGDFAAARAAVLEALRQEGVAV